MSKFDTLFGQTGDYGAIPAEQELNASPSWSVQNISNFSFAVSRRPRPKINVPVRPKVNVPQGILSPSSDNYFDSPRTRDYSFSWRTAEEQGFYSPLSLGFGEAEAFGSEAQAAFNLRNSFTESCNGKFSPLDNLGSELEQSCSSEVTQDGQIVQMDVGQIPAPENGEGEGIREAWSENTCDGEWEGVIKLVQELTSRFVDSKQFAGNAGAENVQQKSDKVGEQKLNPGASAQTPEQAQTLKGVEAMTMSPPGSGGTSPDEILVALSAIQNNVEKIKAIVPRIVSKRAKFTVLVHRQCAAAAGAIKLMSQLADAATAIIPEIQRQVDAGASESCQSTDRCNENSPTSPNPPLVSSLLRRDGEIGAIARFGDSIAPTLAAVTPTRIMSVTPVTEGSFDAAFKIKSGINSELRRDENKCASSLVADLLGPCDRVRLADGSAAPTTRTNIPFQWGNDLDEAIRTNCASQLKSDAVPCNKSGDASPSIAARSPSSPAEGGESDTEPKSPGTTSGAAAQDESDEGDIKGGDQLPMGSYTLMEIDDLEILTEQTHYCNICSKGFKRDANLRMHMRSHGGKYKSSTALVRSERPPKVAQEMVGGKPTRYSCPYLGCSRNMKHPKFQALKTMLCLKNHYRRSHTPKTLKCSICKSKQFSVVADLKTHEKHCGSDKWACSCGTTFSRKEKLYGHVSLFVGHVPVDASVALNVGSEVGMNPGPGQVHLTGHRDNSSVQNGVLNLWQDW